MGQCRYVGDLSSVFQQISNVKRRIVINNSFRKVELISVVIFTYIRYSCFKVLVHDVSRMPNVYLFLHYFVFVRHRP